PRPGAAKAGAHRRPRGSRAPRPHRPTPATLRAPRPGRVPRAHASHVPRATREPRSVSPALAEVTDEALRWGRFANWQHPTPVPVWTHRPCRGFAGKEESATSQTSIRHDDRHDTTFRRRAARDT